MRFFWGFVWSGDPGSPAEPIPDVEVALFGADDADVEYGTLLARGLSQATGFYSVATTDEYAYYNLVETQPEGRLSIAAVAPSIATIRSLDWVQYADPGEGTFGPNAFWEESLGGPERHELIIPLVFN